MTNLPEIPDSLRALMAEVGPKWGRDTRSHIKQMIDGFSAVLEAAAAGKHQGRTGSRLRAA